MSRRWLAIALLLSLGINAGILAILLIDRARAPVPAELPVTDDGTAVDQGAPAEAGAAEEGPGEGPGWHRRGMGRFGGQRSGPPVEGLDSARMIEHRTATMAERLGLEGERRERFVEIQRGFLEETHRRRREVLELQERLRRELAAEEPSREVVEEVVRATAEHRAALDRRLAEAVLATREILDPEQERRYLRFLGRIQHPGPGGPPGGPAGPGTGGPRRHP